MSNPPPLDDRGLPPNYNFREDWEVTPRQVHAMQAADDDFVLLDCRTPGEYDVARIDGAVLVPMNELPGRLEELSEQKNKKVVVHCHHGGRSLRVTQFLRDQGFTDVKSMAGGINVWSLDVDDRVPRY